MSDWDPIGINDLPEAADEYDMYLGDIFTMLDRSASQQEIADYLRWVETERMGLTDCDGKPFVPEQVRLNVAIELQKIVL